MLVKSIVEEDFVNYKLPSMFIGTCYCDFKCCKDGNFNIDICQNSELINQGSIEIEVERLIERYLNNSITKAIVFGGMECMLQFDDIINFITKLREKDDSIVVLYTGYYKNEILPKIEQLRQFKNIVVKYGRYELNHPPHYDEVLGVNLASNKQYAEVIS